jgi:ribA/ribD-fused uncharacterized protein
MPSQDIAHYTIIKAVIRIINPHYVEGAQRIGNLWRIYIKSAASRIDLLTKRSLLIQGKLVPLYDQNPMKTKQTSPEDRKDKLTIRGLPVSLSHDEVKNFLENKNVILSSKIIFSLMRDDNGALTNFTTGDRFLYCNPFDPPLEKQQQIGNFYCQIYHHGKDGQTCRSCNTAGHRAGDALCKAKAADGSILAYIGFEHPLSNHFLTPIAAFGENEAFKSVEHGFSWKMATDLNMEDLATNIKNAKHAGIVKQLCRDIDESTRHKWEDNNMATMRELLKSKWGSCESFRNCLLMNENKVIAEATKNKRWGTGLSKWITDKTTPKYWPGGNMMGALLMELTEEMIASDESITVIS